MELTHLQEKRIRCEAILPYILKDLLYLDFKEGEKTSSLADSEELSSLFPQTFSRPILKCISRKTDQNQGALRVGVVFSGGQASGGHNVIAALFDAMKQIGSESSLFGFLNGPKGIVENQYMEITEEIIDPYRFQGGFDLMGSGRTKIETEEQLQKSLTTCEKLSLDGLVIIGGDDSNTNAAVLAEFFLKNDCETCVIGIPKTIDGDLKNEHIEVSFGFDTACKVYSEMISNISRDALSAKKYTHFIKLMGRSASHIALECALKTHPNAVLISEEILEKKMTLSQITKQLADLISMRASMDKNYSVILIPEGLIEFIPEMKDLISELNHLIAQDSVNKEMESLDLDEKIDFLNQKVKSDLKSAFQLLPKAIMEQLLLERDPHGNVQVSKIDTEILLLKMVEEELKERKKEGSFKGKFSAVRHSFGYEGRCSMPSSFDAHYCYSLGYLAAFLIKRKMTGYIACVYNLKDIVQNWKAKAIPITMLMNLETREAKKKPVIKKALVDLKGNAFSHLQKMRVTWAKEDAYRFEGPMQFFGPSEITDTIPISLLLE